MSRWRCTCGAGAGPVPVCEHDDDCPAYGAGALLDCSPTFRHYYEREIPIGGILCAVTWPGHDLHAMCPNPFCDGYGNLDVSKRGDGKAWRYGACEVGPHLQIRLPREWIEKGIDAFRLAIARGQMIHDAVRDTAPHWDGEYEPPDDGAPIPFYRCDGRLICWDCWRPYSTHPCDPREECLTVLCNGWRVKL